MQPFVNSTNYSITVSDNCPNVQDLSKNLD